MLPSAPQLSVCIPLAARRCRGFAPHPEQQQQQQRQQQQGTQGETLPPLG